MTSMGISLGIGVGIGPGHGGWQVLRIAASLGRISGANADGGNDGTNTQQVTRTVHRTGKYPVKGMRLVVGNRWPLKVEGLDVVDGTLLIKANGNWFTASEIQKQDELLAVEINKHATLVELKKFAGVL